MNPIWLEWSFKFSGTFVLENFFCFMHAYIIKVLFFANHFKFEQV